MLRRVKSKTLWTRLLKFLPCGFFFERRPFLIHSPVLKKIIKSFLSASARLIPLNFLFSSLIRFSSAAAYYFIAFLFLVSILVLSVSDSLPVTCSKMGICVSGTSAPFRLSMSSFSLAIIANWNWSLIWVQESGGSRVWVGQKEGIPRTFDFISPAKIWGFKDCHFDQFGTTKARYIFCY